MCTVYAIRQQSFLVTLYERQQARACVCVCVLCVCLKSLISVRRNIFKQMWQYILILKMKTEKKSLYSFTTLSCFTSLAFYIRCVQHTFNFVNASILLGIVCCGINVIYILCVNIYGQNNIKKKKIEKNDTFRRQCSHWRLYWKNTGTHIHTQTQFIIIYAS